MVRYIPTIPKAKKLMPALQKIGYKRTHAIADLIDNSIYAEATEINVIFNWNDGIDPEVIIIDNGTGLSEDGLIFAMDMAADQEEERSETDLGRFGMGLKTASLSLGRRMTVISKSDGQISDARWDIDNLSNPDCTSDAEHGWVISVDNGDAKTNYWREYLQHQTSGTVLLIDKLELKVDNNYKKEALNNFASFRKDVQKHLAIIFHRFIEDETNGIRICVDDEPVIPWNPVYPHKAEKLEPEEKRYDGYKYVVEKYVLASPLHLTDEDAKAAAGADNWNRNQGIYVYRNKRLIVHGSWLGYAKKDSSFNLARIIIDIPARHDHLWNIDIKKSQVSVPDFMDTVVKRAVRDCTANAAKRWNSRGPYSKRKSNQKYIGAVWTQKSSPAEGYYIDKSNPLLRDIMNELPVQTQKKLNSYLMLVENCYPSTQAAMLESSVTGNERDRISSDELQNALAEAKSVITTLKKSKIPDDDIKRLVSELTFFRNFRSEIEKMLVEEGL